MADNWKRRMSDKIPKMTRQEIMIIICMILATAFLLFRDISCKSKWFSCDSKTTLEVKK